MFKPLGISTAVKVFQIFFCNFNLSSLVNDALTFKFVALVVQNGRLAIQKQGLEKSEILTTLLKSLASRLKRVDLFIEGRAMTQNAL